MVQMGRDTDVSPSPEVSALELCYRIFTALQQLHPLLDRNGTPIAHLPFNDLRSEANKVSREFGGGAPVK